MGEQIVFFVLAILIVAFSVLSVVSRRILRAATYLLFVLIATGGLYLMMGFQFLAAVQISVYAGGIMVLYIFSILLTSHAGDKAEKVTLKRRLPAAALATVGLAFCAHIIYYNVKRVAALDMFSNPSMKLIGTNHMGSDKNQYVLPFEAISLLLLACIVGAIMIARKR
jgi:NADH-quinone oxidoreductase subunit J